MKKRYYLALAFVLSGLTLRAQTEDDLLQMLDEEDSTAESIYTTATFKGTRLINTRTVEIQGKKTLEFRIAHRFDDVEGGANSLFGLDGPAAIQLSFDYSISDRLSVGIERSNIGKLIDANVKYKLFRQTIGRGMPVTVTYLGMANVTHRKEFMPGEFKNFAHRMSYVNNLIVARKFNSRLSLQVSGFHVHTNLVDFTDEPNDVFATGLAGRYKVTKRMAVTAEYILPLNAYDPANIYMHSAGFGVDLETGGHVFQMFFVNSFSINESQVIPHTTQQWLKNGFRWGFNVSRVFSL